MRLNHILLVIAGLAQVGCATNAENQLDATNKSLSDIGSQSTNCFDNLARNERFVPVTKHIPTNPNEATIEQLSDTRKPTAQDAKILTEYANQLRVCRKIVINGHSTVMPQMVSIFQENSDRKDDVFIQLIKQKISWGDALQIIKSINTDTAQKEMNVKGAIYNSLEQQHNAEMAQRQRAAMIMQNAGYQMQQNAYQQQMLNQNQQVINNMNRPINTSCNAFGSTVNCTSR